MQTWYRLVLILALAGVASARAEDVTEPGSGVRFAAHARAEPSRLQQFVSYFPALTSGDLIVLRWAPGGTLETVMVGQPKPPIPDRAFAQAVYGVGLGDKPIQEDIKKGLVSRAEGLLK